MFKFQFKAPKFIWNHDKFTRTLRHNLQVQVRNAAREFVVAAVEKIPIDTGQARGTFLPLGRFLNISVPISGNSPKQNKSPQTGAELDKQIIFSFPSNQYGEYFQIDWQLFYFWFNDFFEHQYLKSNTPWESIEAGRLAFIDYMRNVAPAKLPRLKDFIEVSYMDASFGGEFKL